MISRRPVVCLDIDGVLNPLVDPPPAGCTQHPDVVVPAGAVSRKNPPRFLRRP